MKNKENAKQTFWNVVKNSWTWGKLTHKERTNFIECVSYSTLSGTFEQRYYHLRDMYFAFLMALGYSWDNWRE